MTTLTDQQLLRAYSVERSEQAFAELVRRHVDFVYSAAFRMVCDAQLAEDVSQGVFVALAQNARQLTDRTVLSGWLHRTAQNLAAKVVRTNVRRRDREQEATAMNELLATETETLWEHIAPHLDAALGELEEPDRDAVLLRYFERKSAREMAQSLGVSDDAAQKRVSRAVERLRDYFAKHGVSVGAGGLVVAISANAVQAAPVGLAVSISTSATLAGSSIVTSETIAMTTFQKTLIAAVLTTAIGMAIYQAHEASTLRTQVQKLQQTLTNQLQVLESGQGEARNRLSRLQQENSRLGRNNDELVKLRGEVSLLRKESPKLVHAILDEPSAENPTHAPPFRTYSATNHVELKWGQTIVAGGWQIPSGNRVLVFATPEPGEDHVQLTIHFTIAEIADESFAASGIDLPADEGKESRSGLLERDQYDLLIKTLTQSGLSAIRKMGISTLSGRQALIGTGTTEEDAGSINVVPTISADGKTVTMDITSTLKYPTSSATK